MEWFLVLLERLFTTVTVLAALIGAGWAVFHLTRAQDDYEKTKYRSIACGILFCAASLLWMVIWEAKIIPVPLFMSPEAEEKLIHSPEWFFYTPAASNTVHTIAAVGGLAIVLLIVFGQKILERRRRYY